VAIEHSTDEEAIYYEATGKTGEEREAYLHAACGQNTALLARVRALLKAREIRDGFLESAPWDPAIILDPPVLTEGPGTVIGRYKLLEKIGEGGMAVVYMAEQEQPIRRKVALKIIKLGMDTRQVIARFEAERQALAMMDHPHIAKVLDAGATETGRPYFVMELVQGVSITEYCDRNSLGTKDRLGLFIQVCHAVQHAHQKGVIHRDIKPSNVLVTHHDGRPVPKVIDFGIAKATNQRLTEKTLFTRYAHLIGTPVYMSPEQAELSDVDIDTRSDIYSLGVLLYELLTGMPPFSEEQLRRAGYLEMQRVIREQEPVKPSTKISTLGDISTEIAKCRGSTPDLLRKAIRGDLDWIVMKSLEKDRTRRYDSTAQLLGDVQRHLDHQPVLAGPPTAWYQARKSLQRHRTLAVVVTGAAVLVLTGLLVSTALYLQAEEARGNEVAARAQAQTVTDFLTQDLLASVFPERARNQEVTVRYILENASRDLEGRFAGSPLAEAQIRETLGLTYQKMGDYAAAEPHLQRVLAIRRKHLGEEHLATLASLKDLGALYSAWGRYQQAEPLLTRVFDARRNVLGAEHRDTLESMSDLAWQYLNEARFQEGMALAAQALEAGRRVLGEEDPITLRSMNSLALGYVTTMQYSQAESLASRGYEISRRVLGEEHETTLLLANVLSWAWMSADKSDSAAELAARTVEIGRRIVGEEHQITIWAMSNLGAAYLQQGRPEEAAPLLSRSFELATRHGGEDHAGTVFLGLRLAGLYRAQERYREHEGLLIRLVAASRRTHGEDHPQTGYIMYWLLERARQLGVQGRQQYASGDYEGAAEAFRRSGGLRRALFGNPTPSEVAGRAMSLHRSGRSNEARAELAELRAMYEHGDHAYEADPLHQAERLLSPQGSPFPRAWELIEAGELDGAAAVAQNLRDSDAADPADRQNLLRVLARAYCRQAAMAEVRQDYAGAQRNYEAAARVCPDYTLPLRKLAWLWATCPTDAIRRGADAVDLATRACGLTQWENAECLEALAAGYAEVRDFDAAMAWQKRAIEAIPAEAHRGRRAVSQERLHLYESRRPLRAGGTRSLVARWDFEQVVGPTVVDASGHGHDGALVGGATVVADDERGNILLLAGHGYVECGADPTFDITGPISVTAWIKTETPSKPYQVIITRGPSNWRLMSSRHINTLHFAAGGIRVVEDDPTMLNGTRDITDGRWHHVAAIYDGLRMCLYVDGDLDASVGAGGTLDISDEPVRIGGIPESPDRQWTGSIDDVRIYDYALNEMEIRALREGREPETTGRQP